MIPSSLDLQSCMSIGDLSKFRNITVAVEFDVFNILNSKFGVRKDRSSSEAEALNENSDDITLIDLRDMILKYEV